LLNRLAGIKEITTVIGLDSGLRQSHNEQLRT